MTVSGKRLIASEDIDRATARIGAQISSDYAGKDPILVCILDGAFMFFADLVRQITIDHQVDFIKIGCYGDSLAPGQPRWVLKPSLDYKGRHLIVVDDILDTGTTASFVDAGLLMTKRASACFAVLLSKPARRTHIVTASYVGFDIGDEFVYGYGLDLKSRHRSLGDIYVYSESE